MEHEIEFYKEITVSIMVLFVRCLTKWTLLSEKSFLLTKFKHINLFSIKNHH